MDWSEAWRVRGWSREVQAATFAAATLVALAVLAYVVLRVVPAWLLDLDAPFAPVLMIASLVAGALLIMAGAGFGLRRFMAILRGADTRA